MLLAKHDAIASGSPLPAEEPDAWSDLPVKANTVPSATVAPQAAVAPTIVPTNVLDDEEEEDEFCQLARRNSKFRSANVESTFSRVGTSLPSTQDGIASSAASVTSPGSPSISSSALSLPDPPAPVRTSPEEQIISDLLALTISSYPSPPHTPLTAEPALNQGGSSPSDHPQHYHANPEHVAAPYIAPWAQLQTQTAGIQKQSPPQSQFQNNSSFYPPPPWGPQDNAEPNPFIAASSQYPSTSKSPIKVPLNLRPLQQSQSFGVPLRSAGSESPMNQSLKQPMSAGARRPSYVSSHMFFDDLLDKNADGSLKMGNTVGRGTPSPYKS